MLSIVRTSTSPRATLGKYDAADCNCRHGAVLRVRDCRLREDAHIVDEVHNRRAGGDHVAHVVVSRNGLSTSDSSPHSTPMDAQFTVPSRATVVTIVSMITVQSVCLGNQAPCHQDQRSGAGFAVRKRLITLSNHGSVGTAEQAGQGWEVPGSGVPGSGARAFDQHVGQVRASQAPLTCRPDHENRC